MTQINIATHAWEMERLRSNRMKKCNESKKLEKLIILLHTKYLKISQITISMGHIRTTIVFYSCRWSKPCELNSRCALHRLASTILHLLTDWASCIFSQRHNALQTKLLLWFATVVVLIRPNTVIWSEITLHWRQWISICNTVPCEKSRILVWIHVRSTVIRPFWIDYKIVIRHFSDIEFEFSVS